MNMMVSMKMSKEEADEEAGTDKARAEDAPAYPYGLTINLSDDVLKKLKLNDAPDVGSEVMLMCKCTVIACRTDQMQDGDAESNCTLQITDMDFSGGERMDTASVLYKT
jgi:hypothetical protein